MNISTYMFHNYGANENNAQVFSADKFFAEVVVIICPIRVATRGNGDNLHGRALTLKVWGREDDLSFFDYSSPFCVLLIEFHFTFFHIF